jgi:4-amino-4-deoxy-L-arabinose transferase-like glycosyltransferase
VRLRRGWARTSAAWRRIPLAGRVIAIVALANALAWTLIVPPGQIPDEDSQIAYVQYVGETGKLPFDQAGRSFSPSLDAMFAALLEYQQVGRPYVPSIWSKRQELGLRHAEHAHLSDVGTGDAESANNNPPLYYLIETVPYRLSHATPIVDRVYFMRLFSVLLAAFTALLAYLFVREVLPGRPWAWAAGGAAVAFQPLFAFMSAGVHTDDLVNCFAALELLLVARTWRRGLTTRRAAGLGLVLALGMLTKAVMIGLIPIAVWALLWGAARLRDDLRAVGRRIGAATAAFAAPMGTYLVLAHTVWHRGLYTGASGFVSAPGVGGQPFSWTKYLSFTWQLAMPRLPSMTDLLPGTPIRDTFLYGLLGRFGWLDYGFSDRVDHIGQYVVEALGLLAIVFVATHWRTALRRWPELLGYLGTVAAIFAVVGIASYRARLNGGTTFEQARYLLPLLALYGLAVGAAVSALGRWGRVLAACLIVLVLGHDLFSQLITLQRYYT